VLDINTCESLRGTFQFASLTLQKSGEIITQGCLKTRYIAEQKCPPDAVHDAWIATGRRSNNTLTAGNLLKRRDVLSSSALSKANIEYIRNAQGIEHYRRTKVDLKTDALIPVIYSTKPFAGGLVYYHSVIPQAQWKSWLEGDSR
jgi:hypothetical protein